MASKTRCCHAGNRSSLREPAKCLRIPRPRTRPSSASLSWSGWWTAGDAVGNGKTENPPNFRYGRYRLWGDIHLSRYFQTDGQPSIELIIRSLSCTANARILGQSFQGHAAVKSITQEDSNILWAATRDLQLEPRARILPEERLEAALLLGDADAVEGLVAEEQPGMALKRRQYLFTQAPTRNPRLAEELQDMYEGHCQICLWHPREQYKVRLCHVHHIQWLSRGGEDALCNLALVCPNHHSAIHRVDAPLDYRGLAFDFGTHREELALNIHL
jgi:5-methylcytosine-specific restriction enzyme A